MVMLAVTHVFGCGIALEVRLDRLVLLVELGQIRDKVLDDVGVRKRVDARLLLLISGDTACPYMLVRANVAICPLFHLHKHASVLTPSMFIAQLPQIPSLQLLLKVRVGSISFLILISASSIMGPVLFRSRV
jgi:DNA-directed RNA polymerase subunit N (RpoN/RPB10)